MKVLVSIIMPNYNSEKYIVETIESVRSQTLQDWEMVIVDDCSIDGSVEIAQRFTEIDERISLIRFKSNLGVAMARNRAIAAARGRYIAFLDSDDLWKPEKLEKQIAFMEHKKYALTYSGYDLIDEAGNYYGVTFCPPSRVSYDNMLKTCSIGCLTAMYDTVELGKVYMPLIKKGQDYATWLKILKQIPFAYGLEESLALYRRRKQSISSNKLRALIHQWKIYREIEDIDLLSTFHYMGYYIFNGLVKYR